MAVDLPQLLGTALASAAGTLLAAAVGYRYAVARFTRERAFDKRLDWYERATKTLIESANRINWAMAGQVAGLPSAERAKLWSDTHAALANLRGLEIEAEMYATPESYAAVSQAVGDISAVAGVLLREADMASSTARPAAPSLYEVCRKLLLHAASRLATDVRGHLRMPSVSREVGLYDEDYRKLQAELARWRERGIDLSGGAWATYSPGAKQVERHPPAT